MVVTSDDRNGVVVNEPIVWTRRVHATDSTRGVPIRLIEERCIKCEKAKTAVRRLVRKMSTAVVDYHTYSALVGPKSGFLRSSTAHYYWSNFYEGSA